MVCTESALTWQGISVLQRRRIEAQTVTQEKQPNFDDRLMKRARLLPQRQREAMAALAKLRRQHPPVSRIAAELDVEHSFETEFSTSEFDFPAFLQEARLWHEQIPAGVLRGVEERMTMRHCTTEADILAPPEDQLNGQEDRTAQPSAASLILSRYEAATRSGSDREGSEASREGPDPAAHRCGAERNVPGLPPDLR